MPYPTASYLINSNTSWRSTMVDHIGRNSTLTPRPSSGGPTRILTVLSTCSRRPILAASSSIPTSADTSLANPTSALGCSNAASENPPPLQGRTAPRDGGLHYPYATFLIDTSHVMFPYTFHHFPLLISFSLRYSSFSLPALGSPRTSFLDSSSFHHDLQDPRNLARSRPCLHVASVAIVFVASPAIDYFPPRSQSASTIPIEAPGAAPFEISSREAQCFSRYSHSCTQPPLHENIRQCRNQDPKNTQHYTSVLTGSYPLRPPLRPAILPILAKTPLILFPCAPPELNPSSTSSLARRRLDSANPSGGTSYNYANRL